MCDNGLRCLQQRHGQLFSLQPRQPQVQPAGVVADRSFSSGSALPGSVQCMRQQSVVCRSWRRVYNGLTSGAVAGCMDHVALAARFLAVWRP